MKGLHSTANRGITSPLREDGKVSAARGASYRNGTKHDHANSISSLVTEAGWKVQVKLDPDTFADPVLGATESG